MPETTFYMLCIKCFAVFVPVFDDGTRGPCLECGADPLPVTPQPKGITACSS